MLDTSNPKAKHTAYDDFVSPRTPAHQVFVPLFKRLVINDTLLGSDSGILLRRILSSLIIMRYSNAGHDRSLFSAVEASRVVEA